MNARSWRMMLLMTLGVAPVLGADTPYARVVDDVAAMVSDPEATRMAGQHGLQILNVLWEDTGRWEGSSMGPNISDVTLEVSVDEGNRKRPVLMPVLRHPNFEDKTADVRLDRFYLRVGNEKKNGGEKVITLKEFLTNPSHYLTNPGSGSIKGRSLLAPRDTHALVSAQAAFLPIPKGAKATFHPVIFNYQSTAKNPAVLTLLITRQGTSVTVIDNARDTVTGGASWGQRLFFNAGGERAPLTAERLSDVEAHGVTQNGEAASSLGEDMNLLMLVQVPLRYRAMELGAKNPPSMSESMPMAMGAPSKSRSKEPDMEVAVLGHGALEGPFTELDGLAVERDPRFPVRVTVQFYQATSSAHIGDRNMAALAAQISSVYSKGDAIGSLVVPSPTDRRRVTNWEGTSPPPGDVSWRDFPGLRSIGIR